MSMTKAARYLILTLTLIFGLTQQGKSQDHRGGELIQLYQKFPIHFNIAIRPRPEIAIPAANIFTFLFKLDAQRNPVPYLVDFWTVSKDGLAYTFYLKPGTTFHDGVPVTSADVSFSINVVRKYNPFGRNMFGAIESIETPDRLTLKIKLNQTQPALLTALSCPLTPILPKHVYGEGDIRQNPANQQAIGSGPFRVTWFEPGKGFVLERFDNFLLPGRPYLDKVIGIKADASTDIIQSLKSGKAQMASFITDPDTIRNSGRTTGLASTSLGYDGLGTVNILEFNLRNHILKDLRVRGAIAQAIDRETINQTIYQHYAHKANGPIASGSLFNNDTPTLFPFDLTQVNQTLDDVGYPRKPENGVRFSLKLCWNPENKTPFDAVARYIKAQLAKIGIEVELEKPDSYVDWIIQIMKWEHDMSLSRIRSWGDPAIGIQQAFLSDNQKHELWADTSGFSDSNTDLILKAAAKERSFDLRDQFYQGFQEAINRKIPILPLNEPAYYTIYTENLENLPVGPWGVAGPFDTVYFKDGDVPAGSSNWQSEPIE